MRNLRCILFSLLLALVAMPSAGAFPFFKKAAKVAAATDVCAGLQYADIHGGNVECEHVSAAYVAEQIGATVPGITVVQQAGSFCDSTGQYPIAKHDLVVLPSGYVLRDPIYARYWIKTWGLGDLKMHLAADEDFYISSGNQSISPVDCHSLTNRVTTQSPGLR